MYEIYFYEDKDGISSVYDYIQSLSQKTDKDSRINHNKINDYIEVLSQYGKAAGEPYIKHLDGDIWKSDQLGVGYSLQAGKTMDLFFYIIFSSKKPKRPRNMK